MGLKETQQSIIASEAYWGTTERLIPGCILPEVIVTNQKQDDETKEEGRFVTYISHEDGTWEINFDPAVPPEQPKE